VRFVIEAVRVIDGLAEQPLESRDVIVDDDRITAVVPHGSPIDAGTARVIDGRGRTLLPGLIDAHAHYTFDPAEGSLWRWQLWNAGAETRTTYTRNEGRATMPGA